MVHFVLAAAFCAGSSGRLLLGSVAPRAPAVQAEINKLRAQGVKTIIVMGHDGGTLGTLPRGIDLASIVTRAHVVDDADEVLPAVRAREQGLERCEIELRQTVTRATDASAAAWNFDSIRQL